MKAIIIATAFALVTTAGHSQNIGLPDANNWQRICDPKGTDLEVRVPSGRCQARLLGEIDGIMVGMRITNARPWICVPNYVNAEVRRAAVERYLNEHPQRSFDQFGDEVAEALSSIYPCRTR